MLSVKNVIKDFGRKRALEVNQLEIGKGECVGLLGNNGAGKTTLFRVILDLIAPNSGEVLFQGLNVKGSAHWKPHVSCFLDESFLIDFLTPLEYFEFVGKTFDLTKGEVTDKVQKYNFFLNDDIRSGYKYIRDLSTGSKVRVGIVSTLLKAVDLLILDEPFAHIDPTSQKQLIKILKDINQSGTSVWVSSHSVSNVSELCNRTLLMEQGKIIRDEQKTENAIENLEKYFLEVV